MKESTVALGIGIAMLFPGLVFDPPYSLFLLAASFFANMTALVCMSFERASKTSPR